MRVGTFAAGIAVGIAIGAALPLAAVPLGQTLVGGLWGMKPGTIALVFCVDASGAGIAGATLGSSPIQTAAGTGGLTAGLQLSCDS